jgi:hypothetical protein
LKLAVTVVVLLIVVSDLRADTIQFSVTNLSGNQWQYQYFVSGRDFQAGQGFRIDFSKTLFDGLQDPPPPVPEWESIVFQSDPVLDSDGAYLAQALLNGSSLSQSFALSFIFFGPDAPGSQPFEIFDFNTGDILASGFTTPLNAQVPEPSTILLLIAGGIAAVAYRSLSRFAANQG